MEVTRGESMWVNVLSRGVWKTCCNDQTVILRVAPRDWTYCNPGPLPENDGRLELEERLSGR